jgi:hypothetical protein
VPGKGVLVPLRVWVIVLRVIRRLPLLAFLFHNAGIAEEEYDAIFGEGTYARIKVRLWKKGWLTIILIFLRHRFTRTYPDNSCHLQVQGIRVKLIQECGTSS